MLREWEIGVYFNSGMYYGETYKIMLDNLLLLVNEERQPLAPAEFTAGWYYGLSGHDKEDKILQCYEPDNELTNLLYDGMEAYIAGDNKSGSAKIA